MNRTKVMKILSDSMIPALFLFVTALAVYWSGYSAVHIVQEILTRLSRNLFLVFALLIPIMAGMGLNFGMVLGAMAGQIGLILVVDWAVGGLWGLGLAFIIALPIAILLGLFCGSVLNRAKGVEMVASYFLGFFVNGFYFLVVLFAMGTMLIPINSPELILSRGYGIRNAVSLDGLAPLRGALDNLWQLQFQWAEGAENLIKVPLGTFIFIAFFGLLIVWFRKTKLGQDMRAISQSMPMAQSAGINVDRTRLIAIVISTVLAAIGQLVYLQNIGTLNTYSSHDQAGMFSIAALLVGGASVSRASIGNAVLGVLLFHLLFIAAPSAGQNLFGKADVAEYFRSFVSYGVITVALILHAWHRRRHENSLLAVARSPRGSARV